MSDTTTVLNPGASGDVMNESLVTQSDGITQAKSPRVVLTSDSDGTAFANPIKADPGAALSGALPTVAIGVVDESPPGNFVRGELRPVSLTSEGRIRASVVPAAINPDYFGDELVPWFDARPVVD